MRPSHDTRERTVARLRRGYVAGRLDTDTFSRRVDRALEASCGDELRGLTADLPAPRPRFRLARLLPGARRHPRLPPLERLTAGRLLLGRSSACHMVFADDTVSRRHAELRLDDGRWILCDLGSSNGYSIRVESVRENRIEAVRIRDRRVA